jgi:hypothetical protein
MTMSRSLPGSPEMPRSKTLQRMLVPSVHPRPLDSHSQRSIAEFLGLTRLPDEAHTGIAFSLGSYRAADETRQWEGNTPQRSADALRRLDKYLRRLDKNLDRVLIELRVITSRDRPIDDETAELLFNEAGALAAAMQCFRDRALARTATLDKIPAIRPRHEALTQIVGWLRLIFEAFAAPHVRGNEANLRGFVIACLDADGIDSSNLKEHPPRLRKMLQARVALPTPDWPRTPAVLA